MNKSLFGTTSQNFGAATAVAQADTVNHAGGQAYSSSDEQALAQYAATGCLNNTFYAGADEQLAKTLELSANVTPQFIAQTAIYAREKGNMKDMPAVLMAVLSLRDTKLFKQIFSRVIDNGKMLRNFVQVMRSGAAGRKSLGSAPKACIVKWFESRSATAIFQQSIGQTPSFADVLKMVHPKPESAEKRALYAYLIGRNYEVADLPEIVSAYENYKQNGGQVPNVPFQMLTALNLTTEAWTEIAKNASWTMTRMNLNTFARHGVFEVKDMTKLIADRLRNPENIQEAKAFPYQLLAAYVNTSGVPVEVQEALQDAMEIATSNVPSFEGKVFILPDVSGSMNSPVTGYRGGATSKVRCIDVAGLVASVVLRENRTAEVIPFEQYVVDMTLNPRDSVMTNAEKLANVGGGGTDCSAPLRMLNARNASGDLVIYVSDNQSWADRGYYRGTGTMTEWATFKKRNPNAKLVCIDVTPNETSQAESRPDVLKIGGFSDSIFGLIEEFAKGNMVGGGSDHWVRVIKNITTE